MQNEPDLSQGQCPNCEGVGWTVDVQPRCCNGLNWECGGRGCTGPEQEQVQVECPCGAYRDAALKSRAMQEDGNV